MAFGTASKTPNIQVGVTIEQGLQLFNEQVNTLWIGHTLSTTAPVPTDPTLPPVAFYQPYQLDSAYLNDPLKAMNYMDSLGFTVNFGFSYTTTFPQPDTVTVVGSSNILNWTTRPANWSKVISGITGTLSQGTGGSAVSGDFGGFGVGFSLIVNNVTGAGTNFSTSAGTVSAAFTDNSSPYPDPETSDEIAVMVYHVVSQMIANNALSATPEFITNPQIWIGILKSSDTTFGTTDADVFTYADSYYFNYMTIPYNIANNTDIQTTYVRAFTYNLSINGALATSRKKYGTFLIYANTSLTHAEMNELPNIVDYQWVTCAAYPYDNTDNLLPLDASAVAAAYGTAIAGLLPPFLGLNDMPLPSLPVPTDVTTTINVGVGSESDDALDRGWCPISVSGTTNSAIIVRSVTTLLNYPESAVPIPNNYDVQTWQIVSYNIFQKSLALQGFINKRLSLSVASAIKNSMVGIDTAFAAEDMLQGVSQLTSQYTVAVDPSDSSRAIVTTPVNVTSLLQSVYVNIQVTTQYNAVPTAS